MGSSFIEWYLQIPYYVRKYCSENILANGVVQKYVLISSSWSTLCNMNSFWSNWHAKVTYQLLCVPCRGFVY